MDPKLYSVSSSDSRSAYGPLSMNVNIGAAEALSLLTEFRKSKGISKKSKLDEPFKSEEVNAVLDLVINTRRWNLSADLVKALLEYEHVKKGAVSSLFSKKHNQEPRIEIIVKAARDCRVEVVVALLTNHPNLETRHSALHAAIDVGDPRKVEFLLEDGARFYNELYTIEHIISTDQQDVLKVILDNLQLSSSTLANAIRTAVLLENPDASCEIAELLLDPARSNPGIRGDTVSTALALCIEKHCKRNNFQTQYLKFIRLLLGKGGANVNFDNGICIKKAAIEANIDVLNVLLEHGPLPQMIGEALSIASQIKDPKARYETVDKLQRSQALLQAMQRGIPGVIPRRIQPLARQPVGQQPARDMESGQLLCKAVREGSLEEIQTMLIRKPSIKVLEEAWIEACKFEEPRLDVLRSLVELVEVSQKLRDHALVSAVSRGNIAMCELLLDFHASPGYSNSQPLMLAASREDLQILRLLVRRVKAQGGTSGAMFSIALSSIFEENCTRSRSWLSSSTLAAVSLLLRQGGGTFGANVDPAFVRSARGFDQHSHAARLLANSSSQLAFNIALNEINIETPSIHDLELLHSLLEWGATCPEKSPKNEKARAESIHLAFNLLLFHIQRSQHEFHQDLLETLLTEEIDLTANDGESARIAAKSFNLAMFEKCLDNRMTSRTLSRVLETAVTAGHNESNLLSLLDIYFANLRPGSPKPREFNHVIPPLFSCLQIYPESAILLKRLIKAGCDVDSQFPYYTYEDATFGEENVTPLVWALLSDSIPTSIIESLIEHANIDFRTSISMATPLILAAKHRRRDIVAKLLAKKANVSVKDKLERSALFYAARNGDIDSVNAIIKAKAPVNDGSLHEAARELHCDIVEALIKAKHDPNFPSFNHEKRTAFQEMLLMSDCTKADISRVQGTISAFVNVETLILGVDDVQFFFDSLSNANPLPLLRAFLNCGMYRHLGHPDMVLGVTQLHIQNDTQYDIDTRHIDTRYEIPRDERMYYYSPTMYIRRGLSFGPLHQKNPLLRALKEAGAVDRFHAMDPSEGWIQPLDSVGLRDSFIEADRVRLQAEEKYWQDQFSLEVGILEQERWDLAETQRLKSKKLRQHNSDTEKLKQQLSLRFQQEALERKQKQRSEESERSNHLQKLANEKRMSMERQNYRKFELASRNVVETKGLRRARDLQIRGEDPATRRQSHIMSLRESRRRLQESLICEFTAKQRMIAGL